MTLKKVILCKCGRPLDLNITREGVIMRCSDHGVIFRYVVDCDQPPPRLKRKAETPEDNSPHSPTSG